MNQTIELFRSVTNDNTIDSQQITKFITWGKGNLEQALNYYYRRKEKESKSQTTTTRALRSNSPTNVFSKMEKAMVKQKRTEEFIAKVRQDFKLPIRGRSSVASQNESQQKGLKQNEMDAQFAQADYIPDVFNQKEISFEDNQRGNQQRQLGIIRRQNNIHQILQNKQEEDGEKNYLKEVVINSQDATRPSHQQPSRFQYITDASEYYLGQTILGAFAIKFENNLQLPQGTPLQFRYYFQEDKKKKAFKSNKNIDKNMNMRLVSQNGQFGRLKDEQVRIFLPLIVNGMLRMEIYSHYIPKRTDYYTQLKVKAKIFLLRKAITEPVVQTFEGHSDLVVSVYKSVSEQILSLFDRMQLKIKTWPLIKRKSKLKTRQQNIIQKREQSYCRQVDEQHKKIKEIQQRQRNDPMFKMTQKNISDMFKAVPKQTSPQPKKNEDTPSAMKKRIIQLKTIEEDKCAQLVDLYEEDLQPCKPSSKFISHLYDYQARALAWMMRRQGHQQKKNKDQELHPLWTQFQLPEGERVFLNELTSQITIRPPMSKAKCLGGILADQMGLGKTVMMAALIATATQNKKERKKQGKNLVVVPLTLLSQWQSQIKRHTKDTKTLIYYGQQRKNNINNLGNYDVIITTYGTVSHQYSKGFHLAKNGIYKLNWERIILDEAHYIKGRIIQTAKAVYQLNGLYRWCLTGTPIQNNLTDLFSLVHFIRYTPWSEYQCWNKYINKPAELADQDVYQVLRTILKRVFLRRTKQSKDQMGRPIVQLPSKISKIQILQMNKKQRQFYDSIYQSSRSTLEQLQRQGILEAKYMQVFEILMRLRQICCHPILYKAATKYVKDNCQFESQLRKFVKKRQNNDEGQKYYQPIIEGDEEQRVQITSGRGYSQAYIKQVLSKIQSDQLQNCLVCLGDVQDPVITTCLHIFCRTCAIRQIQQCGICSACRRKIGKQDFILLPRQNRFNINLNDKAKYFRSSKLQALIQRLLKLSPDDKVVVFSQFLGMLDLIEHDLKLEGISYVRMEGSTPHKQRTRIVQSFQKDPTVRIFIVSLKTAGVGLNLVAANKVFLMDPWWNPGVEDQAIERVHRIGQKREVEVVRFIMDRSIEMRMMELNTNKKQISQKALSQEGIAQIEKKVEKLKYLMQKY